VISNIVAQARTSGSPIAIIRTASWPISQPTRPAPVVSNKTKITCPRVMRLSRAAGLTTAQARIARPSGVSGATSSVNHSASAANVTIV
jgi:hypothetical protein